MFILILVPGVSYCKNGCQWTLEESYFNSDGLTKKSIFSRKKYPLLDRIRAAERVLLHSIWLIIFTYNILLNILGMGSSRR